MISKLKAEVIDFRSDTVTLPSPEMKEAMMMAPLGDDVYKEDSTVNELQHYTANMFGMEAALYCPSGTMTNQIAIKLHTQPGDEVITDKTAHIYNYEGGGIAANSGASVRLIEGKHGKLTVADIAPNINDSENIHFPLSTLVSLENTVNKAGGTVYSFADVKPISDFCRENKIALHLDGARLFNALIVRDELGKMKEWGAAFDTISVCLSKGLGAPVGSLLLGSQKHIAKAIRIRKAWGGGMRQAGIIAAAGLYALKNNIIRLNDDHSLAANIREILSSEYYADTIKCIWPGETNIVIAECYNETATKQLMTDLQARGILASSFGPTLIRLVTHMDIPVDGLERLSN